MINIATVVLGVPSGDFGEQELSDEAEIKRFCEVNFNIDFPMTEKTMLKAIMRILFINGCRNSRFYGAPTMEFS